MISRLRTPTRRILLAISISAFVHGLVLWLPHIKLPDFEEQLPPLQAKLEPLRKAAPQPKKFKPRQPAVPAPLQKSPAPLPASAVVVAEELAASAPVATETAEQPLAPEISESAPTSVLTQLPKHARLIFSVRRGTDGLQVGEVQHRLDIADGHYNIQASIQTTGLARWFKSYNLNQTSTGTVSAQGLHPESFTEEKNDSGSLESLSASFDWNEHVLHFSQGGSSNFSAHAQDSLSILYQLSQRPLAGETLDVSISNGKKLEDYTLGIASNETISTAMGELRTVHLRKLRRRDEPGLEIWLAREYRLLPVKIQYLEPDGSITATITITDIRVSDE